jgi:hypothetical protein
MHATTALQYIRKTSATLRSAWIAYTLKRAIADVASMNDQDYRTFGLDKAEILGALTRLHAEVEHNGRSLARVVGRKGAVAPLAIVVTKREPGARPASEQFYEIYHIDNSKYRLVLARINVRVCDKVAGHTRTTRHRFPIVNTDMS